eukprot:symbB.v1.2.016937.t1/scaffold1305.1/size135414/9
MDVTSLKPCDGLGIAAPFGSAWTHFTEEDDSDGSKWRNTRSLTTEEDGMAAANFPASHRSPEPKSRRAGPYDHIQAKIDTNLPESAKSSPRSSRSPSRQRTTSSSPRVSKLMLPTGSRPGSPRSPRSARSMNSRGSADSRRRSGSNGPKSQPSELEDPREASLKLRTTQVQNETSLR